MPVLQNMQPQPQNAAPVIAQDRSECQGLKPLKSPRAQQPKQVQVGFLQQGFEPSPLDPLSKLILNEQEKKVSESDIAALEQAKNSLDFNFTINPLIQQYINYYQGRGRSTMESGLRRSGRFMRDRAQKPSGVKAFRRTLPGWDRSKAPGKIDSSFMGRQRPVCGSSFVALALNMV